MWCHRQPHSGEHQSLEIVFSVVLSCFCLCPKDFISHTSSKPYFACVANACVLQITKAQADFLLTQLHLSFCFHMDLIHVPLHENFQKKSVHQAIGYAGRETGYHQEPSKQTYKLRTGEPNALLIEMGRKELGTETWTLILTPDPYFLTEVNSSIN